MKRKLIFVLGILLFFGFVSVNCYAQSSANDQRIVGTWVGIDNNNDSGTFVFNANGTGTGDGKSLFWGVSTNGEIYISYNSSGNSGTYFKFSMSPDGKRMFWQIGRETVMLQKK
jgi:hypothetical protein